MKYSIQQSSVKPAYLQLYEQLRSDIVKGVYSYGTKLPSKRLLGEETGVSIITVEHAYSILCEEGYVEARQRSGYFVIYQESDFLSPAGASHALHADASQVPLPHRGHSRTGSDFPFSVLARTTRRVLSDYQERLLVKSPNNGCAELCTAIAGYLARSSGIQVQPRQIIIGSGAEYLYGLIVQLLGKDRIFALEHPSYEKIRQVYQANGVECDLLRLGPKGIRSTELERTKASVLHITPFNSYPSGVTAAISKRREYLRWAEKRQGFIVEDNYDSELTVSKKKEEPIFALSETGSVIYLNTFSRTIAPSFRVGYMVLPRRLLEPFEQKLGFYSCTVPTLEQYILAELISSGDFERHINRVRRARRKNLVI